MGWTWAWLLRLGATGGATALGLVVAVSSSVASAGVSPPPEPPEPPPGVEAQLVIPSANLPAVPAEGTSGEIAVTRVAPRCVWDNDRWTGPVDPNDSLFDWAGYNDQGVGLDESVARARSQGAEAVWLGVWRCEGELAAMRWVVGSTVAPTPPRPTVGELLPGAILRVRELVPDPIPVISPPGGLVNLGMWLAVYEHPGVAARVSDSGVWAQATATISRVEFDMGNGDLVMCSGHGDPIPPELMSSTAPSPQCGYTYLDRPQPHGYDVTVTLWWDVRHTGSDGRDEPGTPLSTTYSFNYPVVEIVTVGVAD